VNEHQIAVSKQKDKFKTIKNIKNTIKDIKLISIKYNINKK